MNLCINIDSAPYSWKLSQEQFAKAGLQVERLSAIVEDNRVLAFNKSVHKAMLLATGNNLLLFEDDVMLDDQGVSVKTLIADENDLLLPENWLTIHLGCNIIGSDIVKWQMPTRYDTVFAKLHNCWQSHATYYSKECVEFIINNFPFVTDEYKTEGCMIFDEWLRVNVLTMGRSFVLNPMIAYQRPRKSEIWNVESDYTGAHRQGNEWMRKNL